MRPGHRGRPRHRAADLGQARPRGQHRARLLRPARRRAHQAAHPHLRRRCGLDLRPGGRPRSAGSPVRRPLPRGLPGPPAPPARSAARSGAPPARPGPSRWSGTAARRSAVPQATPRASRAPATRCGQNPGNLTGRQEAKLAWIEKTHPHLYRAYLLKEGLRLVFQLNGEEGKEALTRWLSWAARCRIPEFTELGKKIRRHLPSIHATLHHGLSNGLIESVNTKRVIQAGTPGL